MQSVSKMLTLPTDLLEFYRSFSLCDLLLIHVNLIQIKITMIQFIERILLPLNDLIQDNIEIHIFCNATNLSIKFMLFFAPCT